MMLKQCISTVRPRESGDPGAKSFERSICRSGSPLSRGRTEDGYRHKQRDGLAGGISMLIRGAVLGLAIATAMSAMQSGVYAFDPATYPNLKGQWIGVRGTA